MLLTDSAKTFFCGLMKPAPAAPLRIRSALRPTDENGHATTEEKLAQLLAAARALRLAYLDASPTKVKADAWLRLAEAIRLASLRERIPHIPFTAA